MAMTLRLDEDDNEALRAAAEAEGVSMQELAKRAIRAYTSAWADQRDAYMREWAERNSSLLRRLGE